MLGFIYGMIYVRQKGAKRRESKMTENEMLEIYEAQRTMLFNRLVNEMKLWADAMAADDAQRAGIHDNKVRAIRATLTKVYGIKF